MILKIAETFNHKGYAIKCNYQAYNHMIVVNFGY